MRMIQMMYDTEGQLLGLCDNGLIFAYYSGVHIAPEYCPVELPPEIKAKLIERKERVRVHGWVPLPDQQPAVVTLAGKQGEPKYHGGVAPWDEATEADKKAFAAALWGFKSRSVPAPDIGGEGWAK